MTQAILEQRYIIESFLSLFISSLQETFAQLDLDGNGKLSRKEVEQALGNVLSDTDLNYLLMDLDTDQNGEVEWVEFLHVMKARMREPESVKMLKEAFRYYFGLKREGRRPFDWPFFRGFGGVLTKCRRGEKSAFLFLFFQSYAFEGFFFRKDRNRSQTEYLITPTGVPERFFFAGWSCFMQ